MDYIQKVNEISKGLTVREMQEKEKILQTPENKKYPYKNTSKVSVGEYFPSLENKLNLVIPFVLQKNMTAHLLIIKHVSKMTMDDLAFIFF